MTSNNADSVWLTLAPLACFFGNLLTGLVVVCTFLGIIFQTDPFTILSGAVILSVCTLGLPIIILAVVSYFIGSIVNGLIFKKNDGRPNNQQTILMDYIRSSQQKGMAKEAIVKGLIEVGGWKMEDVEDAYKKLAE